MYGEINVDGIENTNYKDIDNYKCVKCKRVYKCRNSIQAHGCPSCDSARGL